MTLRFGTETDCFVVHSFGNNKPMKSRIPAIESTATLVRKQLDSLDLSSVFGGVWWSDKVTNLMKAPPTPRSRWQGTSD
jgi:hypothetical protein